MNNELNNKYQLEIEVLTPLHVGAGAEKDWMKGADYISDNGKIYILNHKKVASQLSPGELASFLVNKNDDGLKKKLQGNLQELSDLVFDEPAKSDNDIKAFIKNGLNNKPIVPGSSIKGAVRSILLDYFIDHKKDIDKWDKKFETKIFGSANAGDEFMRFIKITDAPFEKTVLVNTKVFNLFGSPSNLNGGWKHEFRGGTTTHFKPTGFNTIYEVINATNKGQCSIMLSEIAFGNYKGNFFKHDKKRQILEEHPTQVLFSIINEHTKNYLQKQIAFFDKYANKETDEINNSLRSVLDQIPADNSSCVLKMSAGSGFHSITGDWQFDDFSIDSVVNKTNRQGKITGHIAKKDGEASAKSRKIAVNGNNFSLMGFVKLSILTDEIIAEREAQRKAEREAERIKEAERLQAEKAEKERIEAEKRAKILAERKAEEERLAKEKAELEARDLLIQKGEEEEKKRQDQNLQQVDEISKSGYQFLEHENVFASGRNQIEKFKKKVPVTENDFPYIKTFILNCIDHDGTKDWKNFKRDATWKKVISWVGKTTAQKWFLELIKS